MQHYVPQPEEDIYELVMFMTVVRVHSAGDGEMGFMVYVCSH